MYHYRCTVIRWIDGDSLVAKVDLGFKLSLKETIRVAGINTPELRGETKEAGEAALIAARLLAPEGSDVTIRTFKLSRPEGKFGRWLASVTLADGRDFGTEMLAQGQAVAYFGFVLDPS